MAAAPIKMAAAAAVIANPWAGRGFDDLKAEILRFAPSVGDILVPMPVELLAGGDKIEALDMEEMAKGAKNSV